jgi:hypothetical protein
MSTIKTQKLWEYSQESQLYMGDSVHAGDPVDAPAHYQGDKMQCIDAMEAMLSVDEFRGYLRGNVFKYQWRFREKGGVEDLRKARWYLDRLIKLENF